LDVILPPAESNAQRDKKLEVGLRLKFGVLLDYHLQHCGAIKKDGGLRSPASENRMFQDLLSKILVLWLVEFVDSAWI
jgi:hypothetical protein